MQYSQAEENYLKAIFKLAEKEGKSASTNAIAAQLNTTAASVTEMLKRLSDKHLIEYEKYRGVTLSEQGERLATALIRKHRLWEVFLVDKLHFAWDEVHDLAEQLEHVHGEELVNRLDAFLGHPRFDPHGDPIPDAEGKWAYRPQILLAAMTTGQKGVITGVEEHSANFLQFLDRLGLHLGVEIEVIERHVFDHSMRLRTGAKGEMTVSDKVALNLYIRMDKAG